MNERFFTGGIRQCLLFFWYRKILSYIRNAPLKMHTRTRGNHRRWLCSACKVKCTLKIEGMGADVGLPTLYSSRKGGIFTVNPWQIEGERPESCMTAMGSRVPAWEEASKLRPTFQGFSIFSGKPYWIFVQGSVGNIGCFLCTAKEHLKWKQKILQES